MKRLAAKKMKGIWQKLEPAVVDFGEYTEAMKKQFGDNWKEELGANEVWKNNLYTVYVRRNMKALTETGLPLVTWLSIKRNDKEPCRDWRHFQLIKNQLCGEENEGLEIYPRESRLVDGSNQYHLWVLQDPEDMLPFGFNEGRQVSETALPNGKQRPFPKNRKPI